MKSTEEMIAVMRAYVDGKEIEFKPCVQYAQWDKANGPTWQWFDCDYRIKPPEPLTPDVISWEHVSPEWKYMARDEDGSIFLFKTRPSIFKCEPYWHVAADEEVLKAVGFSSVKRGQSCWRDSLVERPEGV